MARKPLKRAAKKKADRKKTGRPSKISKEVVDRICAFIEAGTYIETACVAAGIHRDTYYDWLKRAATEKRGPFRDFLDRVEQSMAIADTKFAITITRAADQNWTAAAWMLERRNPEQYGRRFVGPGSDPNEPLSVKIMREDDAEPRSALDAETD